MKSRGATAFTRTGAAQRPGVRLAKHELAAIVESHAATTAVRRSFAREAEIRVVAHDVANGPRFRGARQRTREHAIARRDEASTIELAGHARRLRHAHAVVGATRAARIEVRNRTAARERGVALAERRVEADPEQANDGDARGRDHDAESPA